MSGTSVHKPTGQHLRQLGRDKLRLALDSRVRHELQRIHQLVLRQAVDGDGLGTDAPPVAGAGSIVTPRVIGIPSEWYTCPHQVECAQVFLAVRCQTPSASCRLLHIECSRHSNDGFCATKASCRCVGLQPETGPEK
jgi:hypothetical protein